MVVRLTTESFFKLGLLQCYDEKRINSTCHATNENRFKDSYYACPETVHQIFVAIQSPHLGDKRISSPIPSHLLGAFRFLKKYPTAHDLAGFCKCTEKTALTRAWRYIEAIQALKEQKIKWVFDDDYNYPEMYVATVDGVHCRISEPRKNPSSTWFSTKSNKAAVAYEIAVSIQHNRIVWMNGPFPAGTNDKRIFDKPNGLATKLKDHQKVIADEGYRGAPKKVSTCNTFDSVEMKDFKRRSKARQETVNARLKAFGILNQVFRTHGDQRLPKHMAAMEACCVIVQYEMENGSPLFRV
eukprot:scaffold8664_cov53-Cylindrotheca_fusiformis.AAC.2